jgi:hypothetical protein
MRGRRDGDDLLLPGCTIKVLDDIADLPGIGKAMESVGWAKQTENDVVLPGFFNEFNSDPKQGKSASAERQKKYRERKKQESDVTTVTPRDVTGDVTGDVTSHSREEKRREEERREKKEEPPLPPVGGGRKKPPPFDPAKIDLPHGPAFAVAWSEWITYRRGKRKSMTEQTAKLQIADLSAVPEATACEMIHQSIKNGWQGIFPLKSDQGHGRFKTNDEILQEENERVFTGQQTLSDLFDEPDCREPRRAEIIDS